MRCFALAKINLSTLKITRTKPKDESDSEWVSNRCVTNFCKDCQESDPQDSCISREVPKRICYYYFLMFIYFWERERAWVREGQRIQSRLCADSSKPNAGARVHEPWAHNPSRSQRLNRLSHPGAPKRICYDAGWKDTLPGQRWWRSSWVSKLHPAAADQCLLLENEYK